MENINRTFYDKMLTRAKIAGITILLGAALNGCVPPMLNGRYPSGTGRQPPSTGQIHYATGRSMHGTKRISSRPAFTQKAPNSNPMGRSVNKTGSQSAGPCGPGGCKPVPR